MYVLDLPKEKLLGSDSVAPKSEKAKRCKVALQYLAGKVGAKISKFEIKDRVVRVTVANSKIRDDFAAALREKNIEPVDTDLMDEFLAEGSKA